MILKAPTQVFWWITNRCNLRCIFCLAEAGPYPDPAELSNRQKEFILREIISNRVLKVYLTGGEPLLFPSIYDYIAELTKNGVFVELTTNGTLIDREVARRLQRARVNRVQFSLNGSTPKLNDSLMGRSYHRIMEGLGNIQEEGIDIHFKVTVVQQNIADVSHIVEKLVRRGAKKIELSEAIPLGRAFHRWEELKPRLEDLLELRKLVKDYRMEEELELSFVSLSVQMYDDKYPSVCTVGADNSYYCLIQPNGDVAPCTPSIVWKYSNNIMEKGLKGCWEDLSTFRKFVDPSKLKGECGRCELKYQCRGGCRALAYRFTGELFGENPLCRYPLFKGKGREDDQITEKIVEEAGA